MPLQYSNPYNFGPAREGETTVYGAQAPECEGVMDWVSFMKAQGIKRVCCLLTNDEIVGFCTQEPLREIYNWEFGKDNVCWAEIPDSNLCRRELLMNTIIPFLRESVEKNEKVVVHCMGGIGRTSRILAAFLVHVRQLDAEEALTAVSNVKGVYRNPLEGLDRNYTRKELMSLLKPDQKRHNSGDR